MISYYYSDNFMIILHVSEIKDISEVKASISQYGIEIEFDLKDKLLEDIGKPIILQLLCNPTKTWIQLSER